VALDPKDKHPSSGNIERMGQDADALILVSKRLAEELRALAERAQKITAQQTEIIKAIKRAQKDK
jgi:hypothetical protein